MTKWEYLRFSTVSSSSFIAEKSFLSIAPASKVNLQWLSQSHPSARQELPKEAHEVLKIYPKSEDWLKVYWGIIDHLGSEGWEPFSVENDTNLRAATMHFRRSKSG
jgi:hypothetical protein